MKTYTAVYLGSLFLALVVTPLVIRIARRFKFVDIPGARHIHKEPVPRIGGVAVFVSTMSLVAAVLFLSNGVGQKFMEVRGQVLAILGACSLMFVIGVIDDIYGMRARFKLLGQIVAALIVCSAGITVNTVTIENLFTIEFGLLSWPLTVLWIVGITNAVNLIDGLDGLAAGISAITCGVIAILAVVGGNVVMAVLMLALLGSLTGFLFFNFNPAKIFLGDCGSLFLGFTLASASVMCSTKSHALVALALPVLTLGIPIFDTFFSMLRRFLERRSMFAPDKSHFHHKLLDHGLHQKHVAVVAYVISAIMGGLGLLIMAARGADRIVIFLCMLLLLLLVFRVVGSVRLRETIERLKGKYAIDGQTKKEIRNFEEVQLHFRNADTLDQWWQACELAADKLDFMEIKLPLNNREGKIRILEWKKPFPKDSQSIQMNIPITDRRKDSDLKMHINIYKNGSLESAGRRAALFTRLIEEHGIDSLTNTRK